MNKAEGSANSPELSRINRREFIKRSSAPVVIGAAALAWPMRPASLNSTPMGIVVHSYASRWNSKIESKKYPGFMDAIDLLQHSHEIGAGGIQVVIRDWTVDFGKKVRERREKLGMYLEGSLGAPGKQEDVGKFEQQVIAAKEAGAQIIRTVCTSGRRYEVYHSPEDFEEARKKALTSIQLAEPILKKHKVKLAVENHKDWRAKELVEIIKQVDSEWVGVTLDFGNSIALMEDPMDVITTLAPYLMTTHVKDMGLDEYEDGILLSEVPLGKGMLDLPKIISICNQQNPKTTFNLEMITRDPLQVPCLKDDYWATFGDVGGTELARTLRMSRQHKFKPSLPKVSRLSGEEKLAVEEQNIIECLDYSKKTLGLK
jgi:sugar phosphate isomerase/epimerase